MSEHTPAAGEPSQDERVMSALAHGAAIIYFMGLIAPIVIWATQREKSAYVRFQALQAVAYQLAMLLGMFLAMGCYMCSIFGLFFTFPMMGSGEPPPGAEGIALLGMGVPSWSSALTCCFMC